jgi:hypothetical protein
MQGRIGMRHGGGILLLLAVTAGLALAVVAGASGTEPPPVNTALPTLTPSSPRYGQPVTLSHGTWTGSPTSYTYQWYRCETGGGCVSIPAATTSSYTPVQADVGHSLLGAVTAINGEGGSGSALTAQSTSTLPPPHWYTCQSVGKGKGKFSDQLCSKSAEGGTFGWVKSGTSPTSVKMTGLTPFSMGWTEAGVTISISCATQTATGSVVNSSANGPGSATGVHFHFGSCTVVAPSGIGCAANGGSIETVALKGTDELFAEKFATRFSPEFGATLFTLRIEGCSEGVLDGNYNFNGSFAAISNESNSTLEVTSASSAGLSVGGFRGSLQGTSRIETAAGEGVKVGP